MRYLLSGLFFLLIGVQVVLAQAADTHTFNIRIFGGTDVTPPTTPVLLSATPVATTQIDLTWSSSTDNFTVAGYTVIRGSTTIATTTQISYSDTGLTASTTYSYTVSAFDPNLNYSTTSNSIATTTFDNPATSTPTTTSDEGIDGSIARVVIRDLVVEEGVSTTSLKIITAHPARFELRWGRSTSYELGYIVNGSYTKNHEFLIKDLEPGTTYEYQLIGYTPHGRPSLIQPGRFTTLSERPAVTPPNVTHFSALPAGKNVRLRWQLPTLENLSKVRIVRSHLGYPQHPQDGAVIYQGLGTGVIDESILDQYSPVYYTAFVYDTEGNVSSGAVALVYALDEFGNGDEFNRDRGVGPGNTLISSDEATSSIDQSRMTPDMLMPDAFSIFLVQGERQFSLVDKDIILDSNDQFTVQIPTNVISGNLKSLIVSFLDPTNNQQVYSFLLRINKDQSAYEATIAPLKVLGKSRVVVEIYDYEAFVVATYQAPLQFGTVSSEDDSAVLFPDVLFKQKNIPFFVFGFLLIMIVLVWWLIMKYRKDEDKE